MAIATTFTDPVAVETWDACFRWREGDALRDVTIDDTWRRVADTVASPARGSGAWAARYAAAFARWQLLPDERLLRCAGTAHPIEARGAPAAVVNVAALVDARAGLSPRFHRKEFLDMASLAVRLLDDALDATHLFGPGAGLRIGIIGLGDALARLGIPYETAEAREFARALAIDLAEGCLRGAVALAEERGAPASGAPTPGLLARLEARGMPAALVDGARRHGVRHAQLTSIEPHPLLARLANGASDALAPAAPSQGAALPSPPLPDAERALGLAMQPWIDAPVGGRDAARLAGLVQAANAAGRAMPVAPGGGGH